MLRSFARGSGGSRVVVADNGQPSALHHAVDLNVQSVAFLRVFRPHEMDALVVVILLLQLQQRLLPLRPRRLQLALHRLGPFTRLSLL